MSRQEESFVQYLNAVDETMEAYYGSSVDQDEFEFVAEAHVKHVPPDTTALQLMAQRSARCSS